MSPLLLPAAACRIMSERGRTPASAVWRPVRSNRRCFHRWRWTTIAVISAPLDGVSCLHTTHDIQWVAEISHKNDRQFSQLHPSESRGAILVGEATRKEMIGRFSPRRRHLLTATFD